MYIHPVDWPDFLPLMWPDPVLVKGNPDSIKGAQWYSLSF